MKLSSPRALVVRLIAAELLSRPGTGPLAPRHFPGPRARPVRDRPEAARVEAEQPDAERAPR